MVSYTVVVFFIIWHHRNIAGKLYINTYHICRSTVQIGLESRARSTFALQTRKKCLRGTRGSIGRIWKHRDSQKMWLWLQECGLRCGVILKSTQNIKNIIDQYYLHKAIGMPKLSVRVHNLLVGLKSIPTPGTKHVVQRHGC